MLAYNQYRRPEKTQFHLIYFTHFYRATQCNATHGIAVALFCLSIRPSVSPSRAWIVTKLNWYTTDILIPHETAITLLLWHKQSEICAQSDPPFEKRRIRQISAYNVWTVGDSENVQLWRIGSRPRAFQRAINAGRTLPLCPPKGDSKSDFLFSKIKFKIE